MPKCKFILEKSSLKVLLFSSIFVADTKIIPDYDFVAPLIIMLRNGTIVAFRFPYYTLLVILMMYQ